MISGLEVRELPTRLHGSGYTVDVWAEGEGPAERFRASLHNVFPGRVEAWFVCGGAVERVVCLKGMIKLVLCDRRGDSDSRGRVVEVFLGEHRFREVRIPQGVLWGWKAVGEGPALVLSVLEGEAGEVERLDQEGAQVPYDWEIVMR